MGSILCARTRLGGSVIEAVLTDFDRNGPPAVEALRQADPAGYTRVLTDLIALRDLLRAEAGERPKRTGRTARSRRTQAAHRLLTVLEEDFRQHGAEWLSRLRTSRPHAYARLVSEACQFRLVLKAPRGRRNASRGRSG